MNISHLNALIAVVGAVIAGHVCAATDTSQEVLRLLAWRTGAVARVETAQLPKVQLAEMIGQADMIVIGQYVAPSMACVTNAAGKALYSMPIRSGRQVSLPGGLFQLNDVSVREIVAANDDPDTVNNQLATVGNGATGVHVLTMAIGLHKEQDPSFSIGQSPMLLFLKRFPLSEGDAVKAGLATNSMVFRVVHGSVGQVILQSVLPCLIADASSSEEIVQVTGRAVEYLSVASTNEGHSAYSGSNTGLFYSTVQELSTRQTPKKFKTTGKKIEQQLLDPIGKPMK